jgi:uncharacterized protein HemX
MKKLMLILALGAFGVTAANAQQTRPPQQQQQQQQQQQPQHQQQGQRVQMQDLPEAVREAMENKVEDKDAQVVSIDRSMREGQQVFEITYRKEDKTWTRRYDQEGNEVDDDDRRRDDD